MPWFTHDIPSIGMHEQRFSNNPAAPAQLYLRQQGTPAKLIYLEGTSLDSVIIGKTGQPVFLSLRNGRPTSSYFNLTPGDRNLEAVADNKPKEYR